MSSYADLYSLKRICAGSGTNHEMQSFEGKIDISPVANGKGVRLQFKATGQDGTVFHEETSLLGPSFDGRPCLFVLSNNHPAVTPHQLKHESKTADAHSYIFSFGDVSNEKSFREEIRLDLFNDGSIGYKYYWGMPGGEFAERSGVRMMPT